VRHPGGNLLGAIGFGAAAWALSLRDQFIGWTPAQRQRCLPWVLNNARLERMWQSPQSSIAAACGGWSETMAAYRLFDNESVRVDPILKAHQEQVGEKMWVMTSAEAPGFSGCHSGTKLEVDPR
jgi:hypothetical protein